MKQKWSLCLNRLKWKYTEYLSVNLSKLFNDKISSNEQHEPIASRASSPAPIHCSFKFFSKRHPLAIEITPSFLTSSDSSDRISRLGQWDPTARKDASVIQAQLAIPRESSDCPQLFINPIKPSSVAPSTKRKLKLLSSLQPSPIATSPGSPI